MKGMFEQMKQGFFDQWSEEDKQKMKICFEKMAAMCANLDREDTPDNAGDARKEHMKSFCSGMMEMMSACFHKANLQPHQSGTAEKT
jgi:hypothetical protein